MISARRVGVSILDEEGDGGPGETGSHDGPSAARDHTHHDGHR